MGESNYLIQKNTPKKLVYLQKLLNYEKPVTLYEKAKTWLSKDIAGPHTKRKWMTIVGSTKDNGNCEDFMDYLIQENALVEQGKIGEPPNKTETYSLDKNRLLEVFYESDYYTWHRDIFIETINHAEPDRKIVTDF